ncbi:FUSC family protein [Altericroceibacterium spongiae]|uniref:FUSC family protein n=1 Tax=Altericroceibacterium spongiae TaxID=2320269 RepID=A0A420EP72_9SPHN|nr:FUSC family protein [Altericroceibacterium spongiae]RKF22461.1 FUSC family protein [Altericroceibacterium spongiae]
MKGAQIFNRHRSASFKALRVMIACAVTYAITQIAGFQQGFWAVFTVLLVMQGSVGATVRAATDRLIATVAGAVMGGIAVLIAPAGALYTGISLVVVAGITSVAASLNPRLRVAGLTAAVVMLTRAPDIPVFTFVYLRILEIAMGGVIGVTASRLVLPVQASTVMVNKLVDVLNSITDLLDHQADALEKGEGYIATETNIALRTALTSAEEMLPDVIQEQTARLGRPGVSDAIVRTLWRIRNDITHVSRLTDKPFSEPVLQALGTSVTALIHAEGRLAQICGEALKTKDVIERDDARGCLADFEMAFKHFRVSKEASNLDFEEIGRIFGLAFALRRLNQDFFDLSDRINERSALQR